MHDRDTVTLRKIIRSASGVFFVSWKTKTSDMIIKGGGGGSLKGFIKSVGNPDGLYGMCHNKLQDYELYLYEGIALVSTKYTCYTTKDKIENCGRYIIQFIKFRNENVEEGYEWRITKVDRIIFDNEKCIQ